MSRPVSCPKCGYSSDDGTIYLVVPLIECAPVMGIAGSVVQVDGPLTRRPVSEGARLECGAMDNDGSFCGHRFLAPAGIDALVWSPRHG